MNVIEVGFVIMYTLLLFSLFSSDFKRNESWPWPDGSVDQTVVSYTERLRVQFLVRAHT